MASKDIDNGNCGCLRKHNYSTGAGWKSTKKAKIGGMPQHKSFDGRKKKR
jgi:hypothetical protein